MISFIQTRGGRYHRDLSSSDQYYNNRNGVATNETASKKRKREYENEDYTLPGADKFRLKEKPKKRRKKDSCTLI